MKIGIIGGSGLYQVDSIGDIEEIAITTPFGNPSSAYFKATKGDNEFYFLPRHGVNHQILPNELNHRANIFGFKKLGVEQIIAISAVGSLQPQYKPRDIVLVDQYFDRTKASDRHTFFGRGIVTHISFGDPICSGLRGDLLAALQEVQLASDQHKDVVIHNGGTYINMEGPAFSTRAESKTYKAMGFDIIGMTTLAEAKLSREAEICFACVSLVTDYDSWHDEHESVTAEMVLATLRSNVVLANEFIQKLVTAPPENRPDCSCRSALQNAIMTAPENMPAATKEDLQPLIGQMCT